MTHRVLITGAGGHLGGKLFAHLAADGRFEVTGLDLTPGDWPGIHPADLGSAGEWTGRLKGARTVVHLAGDRDPDATWSSAIRNNIDATARLYHHAAEAGVGRIVFASSNWRHGGRRFGAERLTADLEPRPVNAYGASKLFGERLGAHYAECRGISVICLRIGWTQWTHDNRPGPHMGMARWGQEMWLSDRDFLQGMTAAVTAEGVDFAILNLMSDNPGMRWDIDTTRRVIGYDPQDSHRARLTLQQQVQTPLLHFFGFALPGMVRKVMATW